MRSLWAFVINHFLLIFSSQYFQTIYFPFHSGCSGLKLVGKSGLPCSNNSIHYNFFAQLKKYKAKWCEKPPEKKGWQVPFDKFGFWDWEPPKCHPKLISLLIEIIWLGKCPCRICRGGKIPICNFSKILYRSLRV